MRRCLFALFAAVAAAIASGCSSNVVPPAQAPTAAPLSYRFQLLHSFKGDLDGEYPTGGLAAAARVLWGTTYSGGLKGVGTVFEIGTDGSGKRTVYSFASFRDAEGRHPAADLVTSNDVIYGTTAYGGSYHNALCLISGCGTIFTVTNLSHPIVKPIVRFEDEGIIPFANVTLVGDTLYGTTLHGASFLKQCPLGCGTTFQVTTSGTNYFTSHLFTGLDTDNPDRPDGQYPKGGLTFLNGTLYGTTAGGNGSEGSPSSVGQGTVFSYDPKANRYAIVYSFEGAAYPRRGDGSHPEAGMIAIDGVLYGTTYGGGGGSCGAFGLSGCGAVFAIDPRNAPPVKDRILYTFGRDNKDGKNPSAALVNGGYWIYGTTYWGGEHDRGTVFEMTTSGDHYRILHSFNGSDGAHPVAKLLLLHGTLYGTTKYGGTSNRGTVFRYGPVPVL